MAFFLTLNFFIKFVLKTHHLHFNYNFPGCLDFVYVVKKEKERGKSKWKSIKGGGAWYPQLGGVIAVKMGVGLDRTYLYYAELAPSSR